MGGNTATVKHQTSVEIPQICLDSRFCTVHPFPFPEVQVQVHEDNSQSIGCTQSCGSLALPGCPRGVTSQEKGPRVRRLDPQCLEPIIDSSANGRVDDPFPLWPLRLNSKYKTELYRSRMMFTRLCHERLLGAELDPILPGLNRSWDPDPSFSACHLSVAIVITQSITQTMTQRGVLTVGSPRKGGKGPAKGPAAAAPAEPGTHRF